MPRYRHNPETGQAYVFDNGRWTEMTPEQTQVAQTGALGQAAAATMGATGLDMLPGADAVSGAAPGIARSAAVAGLAAPVAGLAVKGGGRLAQRALALREAQGGAQGASGLRTTSGMIKRPSDMVPEPLQGTVAALESGVQAIPGARVLLDMSKMQRQSVAGKALGRYLGASDEALAASKGKLTDDVMEGVLAETDEMYQQIAADITERVSPQQFLKFVDDAVERKSISADVAGMHKELLEDGSRTVGDAVVALRSDLRAVAREGGTATQKRYAEKIIDNIQDIIDKALEGTEAAKISKAADTRYRRWMNLKNRNVIRGDGTVSRAALRQMLKNDDPRLMYGKAGGDAETRALAQASKDWDSLGPEIPSSGTTERAAALGLLGTLGGGAAIF